MTPLPYSAQSMELCAITGNGKKLNIAQNEEMAMSGGLRKLAYTGIAFFPPVPFTSTCARSGINHVAFQVTVPAQMEKANTICISSAEITVPFLRLP